MRENFQPACKEFLATLKGQEIDAIGASMALQRQQDRRIDWHEFSYALDAMERAGESVRAGRSNGGTMVVYRIL